MNCREVLAKLYDYLDSEMTSEERQDLQKHLEICTDCLHKYQLEEHFDRLVKGKLQSPCEVEHLKGRILAQIAKIDQQDSPSGNRKNFLFLLAPLAAAAMITLLLLNPFSSSSQGRVLEAVYPYAMEHNKCLDHVLQYIIQSHDPDEVQAALANIGVVPAELLHPKSDAQFLLAGAAIAHIDNHDRAHLDYEYKGSGVSLFVLDRNTIDKSPFKRIEHEGKSYYYGACPRFHYIIWECENHECIAVSQLENEKLIEFASAF